MANLHEWVASPFLSLDPENNLTKYIRVTSHFKAFVE